MTFDWLNIHANYILALLSDWLLVDKKLRSEETDSNFKQVSRLEMLKYVGLINDINFQLVWFANGKWPSSTKYFLKNFTKCNTSEFCHLHTLWENSMHVLSIHHWVKDTQLATNLLQYSTLYTVGGTTEVGQDITSASVNMSLN